MSSEEVIVEISDGSLRGKKCVSDRNNFSYFSFQGIPYAQPPVGNLRFKAPLPVKPWTGVRNALVEGANSPCFFLLLNIPDIKRDEDCLFLNVYTPEIPSKAKKELLPVFFWIHGGAFCAGSGDADFYGPDYLVTENVVIVTCNYRLGPLGFLSLQSKQCPGNNGLKDLILALKWCRSNISKFGGDPNNVTICGESAGGAAVHYLTMSKAAAGLFHKAIAQSGVASNGWAYSKNPREAAFRLGEMLGFKTEDDDQLLNFLKDVKVESLLDKGSQVLKLLEPNEHFFKNAFCPCIEPESEDAILTVHPEDFYKKGGTINVPFLIGSTDLEGLIILVLNREFSISEKSFNEDLYKLIPKNFVDDSKSEKAEKIVKNIANFYFPNGFDVKNYINALSAIYFLNGINQVIDFHSNFSTEDNPTFVYKFTYDGEIVTIKTLFGLQEWKGTCHGDDLSYLFRKNVTKSTISPQSKDFVVMEKFTKLWTDFAKNGVPCSKNLWNPISKNKLPYLEINYELTQKLDDDRREYEFWKDLREMAAQGQNDVRF